jgi:hypothetical protein
MNCLPHSRGERKPPVDPLPLLPWEPPPLLEEQPFAVAWLQERYRFPSAELAGRVAELAFPIRRAAA